MKSWIVPRRPAAKPLARSGPPVDEQRFGVDQWITDYLLQNEYGLNQLGLNQTYAKQRIQEISASLPAYMAAVRGCPPAFGAQMVRALVLSQARFTLRNRPWAKTPRRLFGTTALGILEKPWPNATTGELITRMEWHAGLAGNAYVTRRPDRLRVLRPDWVGVIYGSELEPDYAAHALDGELIGYAYCNGGFGSGNKIQTVLPADMAHWSPLPDPETAGMGMSWLTPAIRDMQADRAATEHKLQFFANGAPQPLDARVLTPRGWSTMGAMVIGSEVIGSDGKPHRVLGVFPQGEQDIYRVTFTDGSRVECTEDHLWSVQSNYDRRRGVTRTMSLRDIVDGGLQYRSGPSKWAVPFADPVEYDDPGPLLVDPYLLGLLLGDGCFRSNGKGSGGVSLAADLRDAEWLQATLPRLTPAGVSLNRRDRGGGSEFYFRGLGGPRPNSLTGAIRALGLWDVLGPDKAIPAPYLRASVTQRLAMLQGLLDSDGSVEKGQPNSVTFTNTSRDLAFGVRELARSLGGTATTVEVPAKRQWLTRVQRLPEWIVPFALPRKVATYTPPRAVRHRFMADVELVGRKPAQCIRVDTPDSLYITDDFVLTHNTPNLVVKGITASDPDEFAKIVDLLEERHTGIRNAYRTLYLTSGADATVVGSDLSQIDFKSTQGGGETRISMLSRVPASLLGISEGLAGSSLNAGNFTAGRRSFADTWVHPTLQDLAASLATLVNVPGDAELWFDTSDIPILREDAKDAAEIEGVKATTIVKLANGGFTRESAIAAVTGQNMSLLVEDPDWVSVQVQPSAAKPTTSN